MQGRVIELAKKLQPNYFPVIAPYVVEGRYILVLWCPAGDSRPYTAPAVIGTASQRQQYVRVGSHTLAAQDENQRRLLELTARIPFDDRINQAASLDDLDLGLIREYLQEVKSSLFAQSNRMDFAALCQAMQLARGPREGLRPVNAGLLFFSREPERFFSRPWIELVQHADDSGRNFKEVYFKGPLHKQLRETLSHIQTHILTEYVQKHPQQAEAERFYNYPFRAIEEALANAVYHKGYDQGSPIEIQVFPDRLTILSHPGPMPPVDRQVLTTQRQIIAREYRNRRIGDFLKELRLTEGRGTGFPVIYRAMETNGSPEPAFETDGQSYVLLTLRARLPHPEQAEKLTTPQANNQAGNQATSQVKQLNTFTLEEILSYCSGQDSEQTNQVTNQARKQARAVIADEVHKRVPELLSHLSEWRKREEVLTLAGLSNQSQNRKRYFDPLLRLGWIEMLYPEKPTHPGQQYRITPAGKRLMNLIGSHP